jgi:tRNA(adenine34) deaminase
MSVALDEARAALAHGDVPIGAVVARLADGEILARRHNEREQRQDPTAHAEILALADAAATTGSWRLSDCMLVVTLEPCAMCAGALVNGRIGAVIYGATDPKAGALGSRYHLLADPRLNHECPVTVGVQADAAGDLLREFFGRRRS